MTGLSIAKPPPVGTSIVCNRNRSVCCGLSVALVSGFISPCDFYSVGHKGAIFCPTTLKQKLAQVVSASSITWSASMFSMFISGPARFEEEGLTP